MPQSSAPIVGVNLSDQDWRDAFGDEAGVLGDLDGTAYAVSLPTSSTTAQVGSTTQRSMARLAGFVHRIPAGETEPITIPDAVGSARTDIIALRYDPSFTGTPGPVRLVRIAGTSSAVPTYDASPPGIEDMPLWAITRQPGQSLSQATKVRMFPRLAPSLDIPPAVALPGSSPLGTKTQYGSQEFRRVLDGNGVPVWVRTDLDDTGWQGISLATGWAGGASYRVKDGVLYLNLFATRTSWAGFTTLGTLPTSARPATSFTFLASVDFGAVTYEVRVNLDGTVVVNPAGSKGVFGTAAYPI